MPSSPSARRPATVGRLFLAMAYGIGVVQVGVVAFAFVFFLAFDAVHGRSDASDLPMWLPALDAALSIGAVVAVNVMDLRGDLDEYPIRRRPPR